MEGFVQVAQTFGISAACLLALGLAVWKSLRWIGVTVVQPLADRHVKFLDDMTNNIDSLVKQNGLLNQNQQEMVRTQNLIADKLTLIVLDLGEVQKSMKVESDDRAGTFGNIVHDLQVIQEGLKEVKGMVIHTDKVVVVPPKPGNGG